MPHTRPAQASLTLRPVGSLDRPRRPLSRGFGPAGCPSGPLVSYQRKPTTRWVEPSSTGKPRRLGALRYSWMVWWDEGLQVNRKCPPCASTASHPRIKSGGLAGQKIVAEIDRVQPPVADTVPRKPAPHGAALAVLLVVPVLRPDELGLERHDLGMARGHDGGAHHRVEVLGRLAGAGAPRAVRAMDPGGAMVLGAVERDQHVRAKPPERRKPAGALERRNHLGEHRKEVIGRDRVEHGADVVVGRDTAHAEQRLAVRAPVAGLEPALKVQE